MPEEIKVGQFKVRDQRDKDWFFMDNEYLNGFAKIFGAVGTAIYVSLCRHSELNEQKCFPSQKLISEELNIGTTTVKKYIKLFEKHHLIYIERQRDPATKKRLPNIYWLLAKTEWQKPGSAGVPGKPGTLRCKSQGRQVSNNNTHNINNTHRYIKVDNSYLNSQLGKIATKAMIKAVLRGIPQDLWWKVEQYLRKRYPGSGDRGFMTAEGELISEIRGNKEGVKELLQTIGK